MSSHNQVSVFSSLSRMSFVMLNSFFAEIAAVSMCVLKGNTFSTVTDVCWSFFDGI